MVVVIIVIVTALMHVHVCRVITCVLRRDRSHSKAKIPRRLEVPRSLHSYVMLGVVLVWHGMLRYVTPYHYYILYYGILCLSKLVRGIALSGGSDSLEANNLDRSCSTLFV